MENCTMKNCVMKKMTKSVLEENIEALGLRFEGIEHSINKYIIAEQSEVSIEESVKQEKIVAVKSVDRMWYLNSRYDATLAAKEWGKQLTGVYYRNIFLECGFSNGMYARETLKKMGEQNILMIYEPNPYLFAKVVHDIDLSDVFRDKRCFVFVDGINMHQFDTCFKEIVTYETIKLSRIYTLPNYDVAYGKPIEEFLTRVHKLAESIVMEVNTRVLFGEKLNDNMIDNIWHSLLSSSVDELKAQTDKVMTPNIPAIIVAAGPSLDKNIEELRHAQGKAFIVGVDSSIRMLLKHNIKPDMIVTIDPTKQLELFEDERTLDIPLTVCMHSTFEILNRSRAKKFMFSNIEFISRIYEDFGKSLRALGTGGSVANNAFSLVEFLGFKEIIMIGQDLAFTNNKKHASVVYAEKAIGEDLGEGYEEIEGVDGKPIMTFTNFRVYRDWFESRIRSNPEIHVTNATEGGAKIHGADNSTLKEAIERYCKQKVDFGVCIKDARFALTEKERSIYYNRIKGFPSQCDELTDRFEQCIKYYKDIKNLCEKRKCKDAQFASRISKINVITKQCEDDILMEFVSMYAKRDEYEAKSNLYSTSSGTSVMSERAELAQRGIDVLEAYIHSTKKVKARIQQLLTDIIDENQL